MQTLNLIKFSYRHKYEQNAKQNYKRKHTQISTRIKFVPHHHHYPHEDPQLAFVCLHYVCIQVEIDR